MANSTHTSLCAFLFSRQGQGQEGSARICVRLPASNIFTSRCCCLLLCCVCVCGCVCVCHPASHCIPCFVLPLSCQACLSLSAAPDIGGWYSTVVPLIAFFLLSHHTSTTGHHQISHQYRSVKCTDAISQPGVLQLALRSSETTLRAWHTARPPACVLARAQTTPLGLQQPPSGRRHQHRASTTTRWTSVDCRGCTMSTMTKGATLSPSRGS